MDRYVELSNRSITPLGKEFNRRSIYVALNSNIKIPHTKKRNFEKVVKSAYKNLPVQIPI